MTNTTAKIEEMRQVIKFLKKRITELRKKEREAEVNKITVEELLSELEIPIESIKNQAQ